MPTDGGEPRQLTDLRPGVSGAVWSPDGRHLAATADVFPDCGIDEACNKEIADGREKGKLKVHVADDLLYRHWTGWRDGARTHILLVDAQSGKVEKDLTPGRLGQPDLLARRARLRLLAGREGALLRQQPREGRGELDQHGPLGRADRGRGGGAGGREPDCVEPGLGRRPALLARREVDRVRQPGDAGIRIRSAAARGVRPRSRRRRAYLTDRAIFDDWVDDMRWTPDSRALVFQAQHHGRNPLYRVELRSRRVRADAAKPAKFFEHAFIAGWELAAGGARSRLHAALDPRARRVFRAAFADAKPERLTTFNQAIEEEVDIRPAEELWLPGRRRHQDPLLPREAARLRSRARSTR